MQLCSGHFNFFRYIVIHIMNKQFVLHIRIFFLWCINSYQKSAFFFLFAFYLPVWHNLLYFLLSVPYSLPDIPSLILFSLFFFSSLFLWLVLFIFLTQHDIFPNLRDWGSGDTTHKAREWHCNTSNDTRGVLWGYNMPLMMGEGAAGQNTTPHIKILQSLLLWLLSWDWGGVSVAEWRMSA